MYNTYSVYFTQTQENERSRIQMTLEHMMWQYNWTEASDCNGIFSVSMNNHQWVAYPPTGGGGSLGCKQSNSPEAANMLYCQGCKNILWHYCMLGWLINMWILWQCPCPLKPSLSYTWSFSLISHFTKATISWEFQLWSTLNNNYSLHITKNYWKVTFITCTGYYIFQRYIYF